MGLLEQSISYVFVPLACFLLAVLMIPFSNIGLGFVEKWLLKGVKWLFGISFPGGKYKLFNSVIVLTGIMAAYNFYYISYRLDGQGDAAFGLALKDKLRATRWRAERNFWMSFFCFSLYLTLYQFHGLKEKVHSLESGSKKD